MHAPYGTRFTARDDAVLQSGEAHLVGLDGGDLYATSRAFGARPVLAEVYAEDGTHVHLACWPVHPPRAPTA